VIIRRFVELRATISLVIERMQQEMYRHQGLAARKSRFRMRAKSLTPHA